MTNPYDWASDGVFATQAASPTDSPTGVGQENSKQEHDKMSPQVFHSYQGASWIALTTLLLSWVVSYQTLVAVWQNTFGTGTRDWGLFRGVSSWFADTMANLWTANALDQLVPYVVFSVAAVWLLDRRSRLGMKIGVVAVVVYLSGTWYAQNYAWYPDWAAWYGDWTSVQLVALFSTATYGILTLVRMGDPRNAPQWRVCVAALPVTTIVYGLLLTSTNAAF